MTHSAEASRPDASASDVTELRPRVPPGLRVSTAYLPEVESLRGLAITLVVAYHAHTFGAATIVPAWKEDPGTSGSPLWGFLLAGHTGVSLFFVLSGFLLSLPFLREATGGLPVPLGQYFARRALRILPLYYVVVLVTAALCAARPAAVLRGWPYLLFLNSVGWGTLPLGPTAVWWSLATEVQFYLLLPLLSFFLGSRRGRAVGMLCLAAYAALYGAMLSGIVRGRTVMGEMLLTHSVLGRGTFFLFGGAAAWLYLRRGEHIRARLIRSATSWWSHGASDVVVGAVLLVLAFLLQWVAREGYVALESSAYLSWHVLEGALWTAVVLLVLVTPLRLKAVLVNPMWAALGTISYSLYLVHYLLLLRSTRALHIAFPALAAGSTWRAGGIVVALCGVSLGLSVLTYTWIERPFLRRKARLDA